MTPENKQPRISLDPAGVPEELRAIPRWVCWKYIELAGRQTKVPVSPSTGSAINVNLPENWTAFAGAVSALDEFPQFAGIGFVFIGDGYAGIDLDLCVDKNGQLAVAAQAIVEGFGSYAEHSPSGTGVKIFVRGTKPDWAGCRSKAISGMKEIEVYDKGRFFAVTGQRVPTSPANVRDAQEALERLCIRLWPNDARMHETKGVEPKRAPQIVGSDNELIQRATAASNGAKFRALWHGDTSGHGDDDSAADLALCSMLAFWTGNDSKRIDSLFRQSGLYREKWEREDYRARTIAKAIESSHEVYRGAKGNAKRKDFIEGDNQEGTIELLGTKDPMTGRIILSPKRTQPTAEAFVRDFHTAEGFSTLVCYGGESYGWTGNRYAVIEDGAMRKTLLAWLHAALKHQSRARSPVTSLVNFDSNPRTVDAALETIKALTHLNVATPLPSWLGENSDGLPAAAEIVACQNINIHIPTRRGSKPTPRLFVTNSLAFDFDPSAGPPVNWLGFLHDLWPDDAESIELLQEWFGYCLTPDTAQQKMLLIQGPRRSGKGTIGRVLRGMLGASNVAGPTTGSLAQNFGLQPLLGKPLAIVSDARFSGSGVSTVIERLLNISGEDALTIDRKHREPVTIKLPTRFMFLANELPQLPDSAGALPGRFLILRLEKSFFGHEDPGLTERLLSELPGILSWALDGWDRLRARGKFHQPESGADLLSDMEELASPIRGFVRARCEVGAGRRGTIKELHRSYLGWATETGIELVPSPQVFGRELCAAIPGLRSRRGTDMQRFYDGIALREGGQAD